MDVQERVLKVIAAEGHHTVGAGDLDKSFDELGVDSLDKVCILFGLEKEFGVTIPEDEARQFSSARQVVEWLAQLAARPQSAG